MAPPPGRPAGPVKQPVQVRLSAEEIELIDAFAQELSAKSYGAEFSRAEALKLAALNWLRSRQQLAESLAPEVPPRVIFPGGSAPVVAAPTGPGAYKAQVLMLVQQLRAEGLSLHQIARKLNEEGNPTLSGRGTWQQGSLSKLLGSAEKGGG